MPACACTPDQRSRRGDPPLAAHSGCVSACARPVCRSWRRCRPRPATGSNTADKGSEAVTRSAHGIRRGAGGLAVRHGGDLFAAAGLGQGRRADDPRERGRASHIGGQNDRVRAPSSGPELAALPDLPETLSVRSEAPHDSRQPSGPTVRHSACSRLPPPKPAKMHAFVQPRRMTAARAASQ